MFVSRHLALSFPEGYKVAMGRYWPRPPWDTGCRETAVTVYHGGLALAQLVVFDMSDVSFRAMYSLH